MSKSSYILLADYAKSAGLSLEEARELVSREENKKFFKVANGKEMVSTAIGKKHRHRQQSYTTPRHSGTRRNSRSTRKARSGSGTRS